MVYDDLIKVQHVRSQRPQVHRPFTPSLSASIYGCGHFFIHQTSWLCETFYSPSQMAEYGHQMSLKTDVHAHAHTHTHTQTKTHVAKSMLAHQAECVSVCVFDSERKWMLGAQLPIVSGRRQSCYMIRCGGWSLSVSPSACYRDDKSWPFSVSAGDVHVMSVQTNGMSVCVYVFVFWGEQLSGPGSLSLGSIFPAWPAGPYTHTHTHTHTNTQMQSDWRYGQWRRIYVAVCKWKVSLSYLKEAANNMLLPIVFIRQRCIRVMLVAAYVASSAAKMCSSRGTDVWKAYVLLTPHHQTFFIFTPTDAASHHVNWGNLEDFMQLLHTKYDPITLNRLMCDSHWTEWDQMC